MTCPVCDHSVITDTKGFYELQELKKYEVNYCDNCHTSFVSIDKESDLIYNNIYKEDKARGYDRYFHFANEVIGKKEPLNFLTKQDVNSEYLPILNEIKNKNNLFILEVGCGLGYLTYALNKLGHHAIGIDISSEAINWAKSHYGDFYNAVKLEDFVEQGQVKFDLIIATELIEHLIDPIVFFKNCKKVLSDNGKIIITTPNRDYYGKKILWNTDLPPLHLFWFSSESLSKIAEKTGLKIKFFNYFKNGLLKWTNNNLLTDYLLTRSFSYLNFQNTEVPKSNESPKSQKMLKRILVDFLPIRTVSNYLCRLFINKHVILAATFKK